MTRWGPVKSWVKGVDARFWPGFLAAALVAGFLTVNLMGHNLAVDRLAKPNDYDCDDNGVIYTLTRLVWGGGAVPYRDFVLDYGPLYYWFLEPFLCVAGADNMRMIALAAVFNCWFLAPIGLYLAAWRLSARATLAWGTLLLYYGGFMIYFDVGMNPTIPYTFFDVRLVSIIYALLAVLYFHSGGPARHALIGGATGLAWLSGIQAGVFPGYAYVLTMAYKGLCGEPGRLTWRQVAARVGGMAAGMALVLGTFTAWCVLKGGSLGTVLFMWFVRGPLNTGADHLPFLFGVDAAAPIALFFRLTPVLCLLPILFLLFSPPGAERRRPELLVWAVGLLTMQVYSLGRADLEHLCRGVTFLPPLVVYTACRCHRLRFRASRRDLLLLAAWLGLVAVQYAVFVHNETLRKTQPAVVLLAVLLVLAGERAPADPRRATAGRRLALRAAVVACCALPLFLLPPVRLHGFARAVKDTLRHPLHGLARLSAGGATTASDQLLGMKFTPEHAAAIRRMCDRIRGEDAFRDNPYLYVFPCHCFLYNLLGAKNPTVHYIWGFYVSEREDRDIVRALEARRPPFVIFHETSPGCSPTINAYVLRHYYLDGCYGIYRLYRRYDGSPRRVVRRLTSGTENFTPSEAGSPAERANGFKVVAGHPDEVFAHPPGGARFLWERWAWSDGRPARLTVRVEPAPAFPDTSGTATVAAVLRDGREKPLARLPIRPGGVRRAEAEIELPDAEEIVAVAFRHDLEHGAFWKIDAEYAVSDPATVVNWSRLHGTFVKHTDVKEYTYANYFKTVAAQPDAVFTHPPHGSHFSLRRGFGAADELLDGLTALDVSCRPSPLPDDPSRRSFAGIVLRRLDGKEEVLWQAPPDLSYQRPSRVGLAISHPETIASLDFYADFPSGTYWKICGVYPPADTTAPAAGGPQTVSRQAE